MRKTKKRILFIISVVLILIAAASVITFFSIEKSIRHKLPEWIAKKSDHLYQLTFSDFSLNIFPVSVSMTDVALLPDDENSTINSKKLPGTTTYTFHSKRLNISNIDLFSLLKKQKFYCKSITVDQPVLEISGDNWFQNDSIHSFEKILLELRPLIKSDLQEISVGNIRFMNANYRFFNTLGDTTQVSNARQISLEIINFRTDSVLIFGNNRLFDSDDILIRMNDFQNVMGDSLHVLNIEKLEYSLKSSDIHATGFRLSPAFKNQDKSLYEVYVPRLSVKSKSVTRFALNDSIKVQYLDFESPKIKFFQKKEPRQLNINDINNFNLYALIEKQFSKIEVDTFHLSEANLEIYRQPDSVNYQQKFESIDIILHGFALDSTSSKNPDKIFHADNLKMTVSDYHLRLEDNEHDFKADSMFVSTFTNSFGIKKITINPVNHNHQNQPRLMANIACDAVDISNVNLKTLYRTRKLPTRLIKITKPDVKLQYLTEIEKSKKQNETGLLFNLVTAYLKGVYSDTVTVDKGILNIQNLYRNNVTGYFETRFGFNLSGFSLDSASIQNTDKFFYATDFDLEFADYQMKLVDDLHKINVDRISIVNTEKKVEIENLRLQPVVDNVSDSIMRQFNRSELYNISVPRVTLLGVNLRNAFFYNKLNIASFKISDPKIYFENYGALRTKKGQTEFAEFHQLLFNYIDDFNIGKIEIPNGGLTWVNHTRKGKTISFDNEFSATLENFRLNEKELEKKRLLFSDNFDITVKDQIFQLSDSVHYLRAGEIRLSTAKSEVNINDALLYPLITAKKYPELPTTFQVSIPQLHISHINFQKAFYSKELILDELELNKPKFQVYSKSVAAKSLDLKKFKFLLPSFVSVLKVNEFRINQGEVLTFESVGLEQRAKSSFKVDLQIPAVSMANNQQKQAEVQTENIVATLTGFKTSLGDSHKMQIGRIDFNRTKKSVAFTQLLVNPTSRSNTENQFTITAPKINFSQFDINKALKNNHFWFGEIESANPDISIEINRVAKGNKLEIAKNLDLFPYIESFVDEIKINRLRLKQVNLNLKWQEKKITNKKIDFDFREIYVAENQSSGTLLNSKEFEISTTDLKLKSKDNRYGFSAGSLIYNSAKHNILLKNAKVTPLLETAEFPRQTGFQTDVTRVSAQLIELSGIDENRWLEENIISARRLEIGQINASIFRDKRFPFNHNQRPPWPQDLLKNISQPFVFDSLVLAPSEITYSELTDIPGEPGSITFNRLTFHSGKISNIPEIIQSQKFLEINAAAQINQIAPVTARLTFDLASENYAHTLSGSMGPVAFSNFNSMVEKSAPVTLESGQINRFDFDFELNDKFATGDLYFGYDDFKISILQLRDEGSKKSKLASFWANKMLLNSKNPKGNQFPPEKVIYHRNVERSVINYWWKSIFTGIKQTLGLKTEDQTPR